MICSIGNLRSNSIWEAGIAHQTGWTKPNASDDRKRKEDFIKSKYQWKGFIEYSQEIKSDEERQGKSSLDLYEAARQGDLLGIALALAKGGKVDWRNESDGGKTPLHICSQCENYEHSIVETEPAASTPRKNRILEFILCAELLLQNGAKIGILDGNDHSVLDCAVCGNAPREIVEFLTYRS